MLDYQGNFVTEGQFMIEAEEDSANFFVFRDGKLEFFAKWGPEAGLCLVDIKERLNELNNLSDEIEHEAFYKGYMKSVYNRRLNMKTEDLYLVVGKLSDMLNELQKTGETIHVEGHICHVNMEGEYA